MIDTTQRLEAGMLSATFGAEGELRQIKWGQREILMRLYAAVRDQDWRTVPGVLSSVVAKTDQSEFRVTFRSTHIQGDIHFYWDGAIYGRSDGTLSYTMSGVSMSEFLSNRIGFCALHSMDCAGHKCVVTHSDASTTDGYFPKSVSPDQPFLDIARIRHQIEECLWADVSFSGEVFEMEDQRNWTDASFKTYCTPLSRPFPIQVMPGTKIDQSVCISLIGNKMNTTDLYDTIVHLEVSHEKIYKLPNIGMELLPEENNLNCFQIERLKDLSLSHLRVDLDLTAPSYPALLKGAVSLASKLKVRLEVALFLSSDLECELAGLAKNLDGASDMISTWLIFPKSSPVTNAMSFLRAKYFLGPLTPEAQFAGGTDHYFAELNRGRDVLAPVDTISYSINPQVHTFDDASLFETLAAQQVTARMARSFLPGATVAVSPVTLMPRGNPNKTSSNPSVREVDSRQKLQITAAWTLGCVKNLTEGGIQSLTLFETSGPRGVMDTTTVFPVYDVLKAIQEFGADQVLQVQSSDPMRSIALCLRKCGRLRLLIGNMTGNRQTAAVAVAASLYSEELNDIREVILDPYAVTTIDWTPRK